MNSFCQVIEMAMEFDFKGGRDVCHGPFFF
jgi:hypothetical protein